MNNKRPIVGIILAAGTSSRLGRPKQLMELDGRPSIQWVLENSIASSLDHVLLVAGHEHENILNPARDFSSHQKFSTVVNSNFREGMSASMKLGLSMMGDTHGAAMFLLGDQPFFDAGSVDLLIEAFIADKKNICAPSFNGQRKNPVILGKKYFHGIASINGDKGARDIIKENREDLLLVEFTRPELFYDIDTEEDYERIKAHLKKSGAWFLRDGGG